MENKPFEDKCPKCKCRKLDYDVIEFHDQWLTQRVVCYECNHAFEIWAEPKWVIADENN